MDTRTENGTGQEYQQFLRHIGQRALDRHPISGFVETAKLQDRIFKILKARDRTSVDATEAYERLLEQVEPRLNELMTLNAKANMKQLLPELFNAYEKDTFGTIDLLIGRQKLVIQHKAFHEGLPTDQEELSRRYLEAVPQVVQSPAKMEVVQAMSAFLRRGVADDKAFTSRPDALSIQCSEEKADSPTMKRENRPPKYAEIETLLRQLAEENQGVFEFQEEPTRTSFVAVLRRPDAGATCRLRVVPEFDSVIPEHKGAPVGPMDALVAPRKGIRNALMDLIMAWKAGRLQDPSNKAGEAAGRPPSE